MHLQEVIEDFNSKGINIYAKKENLFTLNPDGGVNASTQIIIAVVATMAQQEASTFKARATSGRDHKEIKEGNYPCRAAPYGYRYDIPTKKLQIVDSEAEMVRMIFDLCIKGKSLIDLCLALEAEGYPPRRGKKWRPNTINGVIDNIIYTGHYDYNGHSISFPAIINEETYYRAKECKESRTKRSFGLVKYDHLLRGLIVCPYCGYTYTFRNQRCCYSCTSKSLAKIQEPCKGKQLDARNIEYIIWRIILLAHEDTLKESRNGKLIEPLSNELSRIESDMANIQRIIDDREKEQTRAFEFLYDAKINHPNSKSLIQMAEKKYAEIEREILEYGKRIKPLVEHKQSLINKIEAIKANAEINITDQIEKKEIIHKMVDKIVPYNHEEDKTAVVVVYFKSGIQNNIIYQNTGGKRYYSAFNNETLRYNFPQVKGEVGNKPSSDFTLLLSVEGMFDSQETGNYELAGLIDLLRSKGLFNNISLPKEPREKVSSTSN